MNGEIFGNLTTAGLLWDGLGIIVLGLPAVYRSSQGYMKESAASYSYNINYVKAKISDQLDLALGSIMLAIGFGLQFLGSISEIAQGISTGVGLWVAPFLLLVVYHLGLKKKLASAWVLKARRNRWDSLPESERDYENNPYDV